MRNAYNMTPSERSKAFRIVLICLGIGLVLMGFMLFDFSGRNVTAESAGWESVMAARLILFRLAVAIPAAAGAVLSAVYLFGMLDRSSLGKRLFHWAPEESAHVMAAKTNSAGLVIAALVLGLLTLLAGALR